MGIVVLQDRVITEGIKEQMTFWHKLRHWLIETLTYIEKFDSVTATGQVNLPDVLTMTIGHKLRHWPTVTPTHIEKFH